MSGYRYIFPKGTSESMLKIMQDSKDSITYKRAQSVYLRSKYNYSPQDISNITGLSISRINDIHSLYKNYGREIVFCGKRGGRNNYNLTQDEEQKFLKKYESNSLDGKMITANSIHNDLEKFLSKKIHKSGLYKMLKRNGWRKILPRPKSPMHDEEAIDAFKKTSFYWSKKQM